jgi:hypothetical protein
MTDTINQIANRLGSLIADDKADLALRLGASDADGRPNAEQTLSNSKLLLGALSAFYGDPKAEFFPTVLSKSLHDQLIQIEGVIAGIPTNGEAIHPDTASSLLRLMEDLYVYCLQFGLITYGFTGKVAQEQLEIIRRSRQQTEAAAKKLLGLFKERELEIEEKLTSFESLLGRSESSFSERANERLEALKPLIDQINTLLESGKTGSEEIERLANDSRDNVTKVESARGTFDVSTATVIESLNASKSVADSELATIQNISLQLQRLESEAKVMHQSVTDARSKLNDQMIKITDFYGEIETHRHLMTESGKAAQGNLAALRKSSELSVEELTKRTGEVVEQNEALIDQIKDHLRKAIGASLFTAFDTRRRRISVASWVWAFLLLASVGGTIWFAFWFVSEIAKLTELVRAPKPDGVGSPDVQWMLVYARLIIVAPLAFLITFTAKRYTVERRAEEEWAFKSAISISLDPFRDLIARMKKDGQETVFVERLVAEIFDNPTKRLYSTPPEKEEKSEIDAISLVKEALDKIPKGG